MADYDQLAELYDETRGGEQRGDEYAADIAARLLPGDGPVLEIGVGTGVVALGLGRRGRQVVGVDIASEMLRRAHGRVGARVARGDAMSLPFRDGTVRNAYSVWVLQAVDDASKVEAEAARVLEPGGRYVVCLTQTPDPDDAVGRILEAMGAEVRRHLQTTRHVDPPVEQILEWGRASGLSGSVDHIRREWQSSPAVAVDGITRRMWAGIRALDEETIERISRPAVAALQALPASDTTRRATSPVVVLDRSVT